MKALKNYIEDRKPLAVIGLAIAALALAALHVGQAIFVR